VNHADMGDSRVGLQGGLYLGQVGGVVFGKGEVAGGEVINGRHLPH
jgi:hypothetical protein